jgi:secreted trypsin-like serine protease
MTRKAMIVAALAAATLIAAGGTQAITFGQLDTTNRFPQVGGLVAEFDGEKFLICSGTLIEPDVFLTASHCTVGLDEVWVTFDPSFDDDSPLLPGTAHTNPLFASGGQSNTFDIAVVVLDDPVAGVTPARLPSANFLDSIRLKDQRFTPVGYGTVRESKRKGPQTLFFDAQRRFADQGFRSLTKSWLNLSMNPSTGSGGTCFGDSGGPHFLGNSNLVVSITVTGDRFCRASDVTYRTDTASARAFLDDFVDLP